MYKLNNSTTYTALKVVEKSKGSTIANGDTWVTTIDVPVVGGVLSTLDADSVDTSYLRIVVGTTSVSRTFKWRARRMIPGASPYIEDSGDVNLTTTTGTFLGINLHNYTNVSGLANYRDAAKEIYAVEIYV